jgi:hypothetical protein
LRNLRTAHWPWLGYPALEALEGLTMPVDDRVRLHNDERVAA